MVRCLSLFIALWLQASPMVRWAMDEFTSGSLPAIVIRIGGVSAALLGGAVSMSGATTWVSSTNPPAGSVNVAYTYRLQTAGNHSAGSWSSSPLPAGLAITTSAGQFFVKGTPTAAGTNTVTLTGWEFSNKSGPAVTGTARFAFTNVPPAGTAPSIATAPHSQRRLPGTNATFSVTGAGTAPLKYQWRKDSSPLAGQTNATLTFTNLTSTDAGSLVVVLTNGFGAITSTPVNLLVASIPKLSHSTFGSDVTLAFLGETGVTYRVESSPTADFVGWALVTNITPLLDGMLSVTNAPPAGTNTFFRLRLLSP